MSEYRRQLYAMHRERRLIPIHISDIQQHFRLDAVNEQGTWIIRAGGVEIRNRNRNEALADYATIKGYKVVRGPK